MSHDNHRHPHWEGASFGTKPVDAVRGVRGFGVGLGAPSTSAEAERPSPDEPTPPRRGHDVGSYSMRVVQRLTGLSPDTIRVWERRYGAVKPKRTPGGTRRFSERDVRRLALLRKAVEGGHRIGAIAALSGEELQGMLDGEMELAAAGAPSSTELDQPEQRYQALRERYLDAIERFDVPRATELLSTAAALLDRDSFLFEVVLPVLRQVGEAWEAGKLRIAHEHLVSAQVRGLVDILWRQSTPLPGAARVLVATPPGERHEFGAAMASLIAAARGFQTIYLGPDLPWEDIDLARSGTGADLLVLSVIHPLDPGRREELARELRRLAGAVDVWVGMPASHEALGDVREVRYFAELEEFAAALVERGARRPRRRKKR